MTAVMRCNVMAVAVTRNNARQRAPFTASAVQLLADDDHTGHARWPTLGPAAQFLQSRSQLDTIRYLTKCFTHKIL